MKPWLKIWFVILLFICCNAYNGRLGAQLMEFSNARVTFVSDAKLENIQAENNKAKGVVDLGNNKFIFSVDIKSFQGFNSKLQREHFMESYMQADTYPKATFSGKLIDKINTNLTTQKIRVKGDLEIHGIKKERIIDVQLTQDKDGYQLLSSFNVALEDHQIIIPRVVYQKISPIIQVSVAGLLITKKQ